VQAIAFRRGIVFVKVLVVIAVVVILGSLVAFTLNKVLSMSSGSSYTLIAQDYASFTRQYSTPITFDYGLITSQGTWDEVAVGAAAAIGESYEIKGLSGYYIRFIGYSYYTKGSKDFGKCYRAVIIDDVKPKPSISSREAKVIEFSVDEFEKLEQKLRSALIEAASEITYGTKIRLKIPVASAYVSNIVVVDFQERPAVFWVCYGSWKHNNYAYLDVAGYYPTIG